MVMNVLEEHSGSVYTGLLDGNNRSRPNRLFWSFRLHGPIAEKTTISNLNVIHLPCNESLCYKNPTYWSMQWVPLLQKSYIQVRQYIALLFYIIPLSEQQCVAGNIITNSTVYCLMSVCSCFVMVLKIYIFSAVTHSRRRSGVVMVWRVATLPMSCYIVRKITTKGVPQSYTGHGGET